MLKRLGLLIFFCLGMSVRAQAESIKYVAEADLAKAVQKEFVEQVSDNTIDVEFFGGQTSFSFADVSEVKIMLSAAQFEEMQNKFSCEVEIFGDGKSLSKTRLQGKYYVMGEIWVPAKNINKGEVITQNMLKKITARMDRIKPQNVVEQNALVGREAKRTLREGKVINDKDIGKVILIKKGDIVSSIYRTNKMQISAKVEAMEEGAKGDKIEVRNINSKKVLFAEVMDEHTVLVEVR